MKLQVDTLHLANHTAASGKQVDGTETADYGEKREVMLQHVAVKWPSRHAVIVFY